MAWIAAIIGAVASGASASKQKSAAKKSAAEAAAAGTAGYDAAIAGQSPYTQLGADAASKLGRLTGSTGYRTDEEEALTKHLAAPPTLASVSMPDKYKVKPFSKEAGEVGTRQSIDTGWALKYYGKQKKKAKAARAAAAAEQAAAEQKYQQELADWEARKVELQQASDASLENYDPNAYLQSLPGYQARYEQGSKMVENAQSGRALGGRAVKELQRYGQDYASNEYNNEYNRLMGMANLGSTAATTTGSYNIDSGETLANQAIAEGQADMNYYSDLNTTAQAGLDDYGTYQSAYSQDAYNPNPTADYSVPPLDVSAFSTLNS